MGAKGSSRLPRSWGAAAGALGKNRRRSNKALPGCGEAGNPGIF